MSKNEQKCGLISLIGFPNSGKSTLVNNLVNSKISIISSKVQTTQKAIRGILNLENNQMIFIDTPGLLEPKSFLDKNMTRDIYKTFYDSDINLVIFDVRRKIDILAQKFIKNLIKNKNKNILVINKIDLVKKERLLYVSKKLNEIFKFEDTFMISALKKKGLKELINKLKNEIPKKKWIYDISDITDQKDDFICSEITREKIFKFLNKELPYSVRIQTEIVKKKTIYKIFQTIFMKKESQKAILIGKNGEKLKKIAMSSRLEMEKKYKQKFFLEVFVTIEKKNR